MPFMPESPSFLPSTIYTLIPSSATHLGELFAELVQFLLQGGLHLLRVGHLGADLADRRVQTRADHDPARLAGRHVSAREEDVLLVLWRRDGVSACRERCRTWGRHGERMVKARWF